MFKLAKVISIRFSTLLVSAAAFVLPAHAVWAQDVSLPQVEQVDAQPVAVPQFTDGQPIRLPSGERVPLSAISPQTASLTNTAVLLQRGQRNRIVVSQQGSGVVAVEQWGNLNRATIEQSGRGNRLQLEQFGNSNRAELSQFGDEQLLSVTQLNNNNAVSIVQASSSPLPEIRLRQTGNQVMRITSSNVLASPTP